MIPEAAVEAAAKRLAILNSDAGDQLTDHEWARELLEAAAPHMLAEAWDEGFITAEDEVHYHHKSPNPYR